MTHIDLPFHLSDAHGELLAEELAAAHIPGLIGVQTVPTGGTRQHQAQVPAKHYAPNLDWPFWLPNPDWHGDPDAHDLYQYIVDGDALRKYLKEHDGINHPTPAYTLIEPDQNPEHYQTITETEPSGVEVLVRLSEPSTPDTMLLINSVVEKHNAKGLSARERNAQAAADERAQAVQLAEGLLEHADPNIRGLAAAVAHLLKGAVT